MGNFKDKWAHRVAVMHPPVSKMDEAVYLALQNNKVLRVISDVTATRGDVERPLFWDGEVHVGKEDRDEENRGLLAKRLGIPEVLAFSYEGAYSNAKRDGIVAKVVEALLNG